MRVLIVDDDPASQIVTARLLRGLGCDVDGVSNGREAVDAASRNDYDAILMDVVMPEMNGLEAVREIRGASLRPVVIGITSYDLNETCLSAGMAAVLPKPIDFDVLKSALGL